MGSAAATINCEENGLWPTPQPGNRADQVKGKEDPKSPGEYAKHCIKDSAFQVLCSEVQAENMRIDMLNGCKERNSSSGSPGLRIPP